MLRVNDGQLKYQPDRRDLNPLPVAGTHDKETPPTTRLDGGSNVVRRL